MIPKLLEEYRNNIVPELMGKFNYKNKMQVPSLKKIILNMGIGKAHEDIKILESAMAELAMITGQKPVMTRAKKAIANFKIREGMPVGCKVTLRRARMYDFFYRLVNVALPRIKDFRGVSVSSFDSQGNYAFGLTEQNIFPEIDIDKVKRIQGMDIIVVTTAKNKVEARELLKCLGVPFKN
ncbi:MAG: 50S ribosomal protein L5 [Candidatus Omnitrophota bacterium]|nr:MAG: 50S ribosomal protein L5 [Candidatus Omnitrophota bacterium]